MTWEPKNKLDDDDVDVSDDDEKDDFRDDKTGWRHFLFSYFCQIKTEQNQIGSLGVHLIKF